MKVLMSILYCAVLSSLYFVPVDSTMQMEDVALEYKNECNLSCFNLDTIDLEANVIAQLNIDPDKIAREFISQKRMPNNFKETIMVIPEIAKEEEDYTLFNAYILIVNNESGKIVNKYFEASAWQSDAIILSEIKIDTAPYILSENKRAFGVKARYHTLSQPNPYASSTLSLFVKSGQTLEEILRTYEVVDYKAEWNMRCAGESVGHEKTLTMTTKKTNDHYNILVKDEITFTESFEDKNGDCNSTEKITIEKRLLKFNGEEYTENGRFTPLDVYLSDPDQGKTNIRKEPNGRIILKIDGKDDYYTLTITEARDGWFRLVNIMGVEGDNVEIPDGGAWIHHAVIGVSIRRNKDLLEAPGSKIVVGTVEQETEARIKDRYMDWVQIEYNGVVGWIESMWLCGNPVSTCP